MAAVLQDARESDDDPRGSRDARVSVSLRRGEGRRRGGAGEAVSPRGGAGLPSRRPRRPRRPRRRRRRRRRPPPSTRPPRRRRREEVPRRPFGPPLRVPRPLALGGHPRRPPPVRPPPRRAGRGGRPRRRPRRPLGPRAPHRPPVLRRPDRAVRLARRPPRPLRQRAADGLAGPGGRGPPGGERLPGGALLPDPVHRRRSRLLPERVLLSSGLDRRGGGGGGAAGVPAPAPGRRRGRRSAHAGRRVVSLGDRRAPSARMVQGRGRAQRQRSAGGSSDPRRGPRRPGGARRGVDGPADGAPQLQPEQPHRLLRGRRSPPPGRTAELSGLRRPLLRASLGASRAAATRDDGPTAADRRRVLPSAGSSRTTCFGSSSAPR